MRRGLAGGFVVSVLAAVCIAVGVEARQPGPPPTTYLVQLSGPVLDTWKTAIAGLGGELEDYVPPFAFHVRMTPDVAGRVRRLPFVTSIDALRAQDRESPRLTRGGQRLYVVRLERGADARAIESTARGFGLQVLARGSSEWMVIADAAQVDRLATLDGVSAIANYAPHIKHNEFGGGVIMGSAAANALGYDGSTQTIAISDTGLGLGTAAGAHPDIAASRVSPIFNWPGVPDFCFETISNDGARDVDTGHGTHVATAALGAGNGAGVGRGMAPAATLVFQALENYAVPSLLCSLIYGLPDGYYLVGIPSNIGDLFSQAYAQGARVHSNSWGSEVAGEYTADAANVDSFVWSHRDLTVTYSAGNSGTDADGDGVVDLGSINSPATAKNVIAVGASENDRQSHWECDAALSYTTCAAQGGQNAIFTYGSAWPDRYPANPLRDDPSAGNAEQIAAFSSRGPTTDGRIKPDVVAPGTWNLSGYASLFQQQYDPSPNPVTGQYQYDGWGFPANDAYKYMGGTSMAAPLVGGGAAVVRDFYEKARAHQASAALVKAVLINSAVDLLDENNDGVLDNASPIPNPHEGWGRVDLVNATDSSDQYFDETVPLSTGGSTSFTFDVTTPGAPLKATLVWTDYPASTTASVSLVNDLDLTVTAPDGTVYRGNVFDGGWSIAGGAADRLNNVENVYVFAAVAGTWTITVDGYNVPQGPQTFALVIDTPAPNTSTLPVVRLSVDDNAATEAGPTSGQFRFTRSGDTTAALEVAYTVTGTATAGSDYTTLSGFVTIPEGAVDATVSIDPVDDPYSENPETVILTVVATAAYTVASPTSGVVTITSDDLPPDLAVSALTAPTAAGAGTPMTVNVSTKNQGSGASPASRTGFYLSANTTWDAGDTFVGERSVPALAAAAIDVAVVSVDVPAGFGAGTYYLIAKADWAAEVVESSETNNTRASAAIKVGPDLIVSALTAPGTAAPGDTMAINDTTKNQGAGAAAASSTWFYLSSNTTLDAADTLLASRAVNALVMNATESATTMVTIPAGATTGLYYVLAKADGAATVAEYLETNNVKASGVVAVGPDLVVSSVTAPSVAGAGGTVVVNDVTQNTGTVTTPPSLTGFFLSTNNTLDANDVTLDSRAVPSLSPGQTSAASTTLTLPAGINVGSYFIIAKADVASAVVETGETNNNRASQPIHVGPDLVVSVVTAPGIVTRGVAFTISDTTTNVGGPAPASTTSYYLSTNNILDASDLLLGTRSVGALASGAQDLGQAVVTIDASQAVGSYYIVAKADHAGVVVEYLESNNTKARSIKVQ